MLWKPLIFQLSLVICLTGFYATEGFAQDAEQAEKEMAAEKQADQDTDADRYGEMSLDEIAKDFSAKMRAYSAFYRAAPTAKEKRQVANNIPTLVVYQTRLSEMVNEKPGSEAGLEVIDWWYRRARRYSGDVITRLTLKNYAQLESMEKYVPRLVQHLPQEEAVEQLRMLVDTNPFDSVKGTSTYQLHDLLLKQVEELEGDDAAAVLAEVKSLRKSIYEKYSDAVDAGGATYASLMDAKDYESKLEIGKPVPDIVGRDLDGVDFKLSDYEGKVRVISFWGDW